MSSSRGYIVQKEGSRKFRYDGIAACYENGASSTGGRQKAEKHRFAAYYS